MHSPSHPITVTATSDSAGVTLTAQPGDDGGSPVTLYLAKLSPTSPVIATSPTPTITVPFSAVPSGPQSFVVHARNAMGTSYASPASNTVVADPLAGRCLPAGDLFGPDSFWRADVSQAPAADNSTAIVADLVGQVRRYYGGVAHLNISDWTASVVVADPDTPRVQVAFNDAQRKGYSSPAWTAARQDVPIPDWAVPSPGRDAELTVIDPAGRQLWAFWHAAKAADGTWSAVWGGRLDLDTSLGYFPAGLGETASGLPLAGGCLGIRETTAAITAGTGLNHALCVAVPSPAPWRTWSWPAQRSDGLGASTSLVQEGQRFVLPALPANLAQLSPICQVAARTAATRGLIVDDTAGAVSLYAEWSGMVPGPSPWSGPMAGGHAYDVLRGFPWGSLIALPLDYGKP